MKRILAFGLVLVFVLAIGAGSAWSAAPPTIIVDVIGAGKVTGPGITCGMGSLTCYSAYASGSGAQTFTATPANGWTLTSWSDDTACPGAPATCQVTPSGDMTVTATFQPARGGPITTATYSVGVSSNGDVNNNLASGAHSSNPIDCSGDSPTTSTACSIVVTATSTITVRRQPDAGAVFTGWGGACSGKNITCSSQVNVDTNVSASFLPATTSNLTITVDPGGSVTGSGGISCGSGQTCTYPETPGSTVTLTESAQGGYAFTGWAGTNTCTGTQSTCTIQIGSSSASVTANFDPLVPVVISVSGNGTVTGAGVTCGPGPVTCTGSTPPNMSVLLTASSSSVSWSGCTSVSGTICRISVTTTPVSVTATFSGGPPPPSTFQLSVDVSGNGYVTSSNGSIYCTAALSGQGCTAQLSQNTSITLTAVSASGANADFTAWGGDCVASTTTTCTLTMSSAKTVTAAFFGDDTTYTLSAQTSGTGSGTITGAGLKCSSSGGSGCSSPQAATATVTVTASPNPGSTFTGWGGACSGTSTTCRVQMTAAKSVTATFAATTATPELTITVIGAGTVKSSAGECTSVAKQTRLCTQDFAANAKVTLVATPEKGQAFFGWAGACTGGASTCTLTMTKSTTVTATFAPPTLVASHRPRVLKSSAGFHIVVGYSVKEKGTLKLLVTRSTAKVNRSKSVAANTKGTIAVNVRRHGRYTATLTLTSKTGVQTIRWTVVV